MKVNLCHYLKNKVLKSTYLSLVKFRDNLLCEKVVCNVGDLMLLRDCPYEGQLIATSRLLDIETYHQGDKSFPYQNAIFKARTGKKDLEWTGYGFKALLESVEHEGFRDDSWFSADKEFRLSDGTHRAGVCLYYGIQTFKIRVLKRKVPYMYGGDWLFNIGLESAIISKVYERFDIIQKKLIESGNTFCAIMLKPIVNDVNLVDDIERMCRVHNVNNLQSGGVIIQFSMMQPDYIISRGKLVSQRAEEIERLLNKRAGSALVKVSRNCTEGKEMFDKNCNNQ